MNENNYKAFALIMVGLGVTMLAAGLMIYFMYPKLALRTGPTKGGEEISEGQIQDDTFRPDEATGTDS